jgi:hypothetical protein
MNGVSGRTVRTDRAREKFLGVLAQTCNVSEAARTAGMSRNAAYEWRKDDAAFAEAWAEAEQEAADKLEREAWRRAVEGTDKPIVHQGLITGTYKEYSDRMLEILLKGHRPERFVDRVKQEVTGKDGGPVQMQVAEDADAFTRTIAGIAARGGAGSIPEQSQP